MAEHIRRKLLKAITTGSGAIIAGKTLPETWGRPVVDSVVLPAHAQTSLTFGGAGLSVALNETLDETMLASLIGTLIPQASAGEYTGGPVDACALLMGDMLDVTFQSATNNARRQGMLSTSGTPGILKVIAATTNNDCTPRDVQGAIRNYDPASGFDLLIGYPKNTSFPETYSFLIEVPVGDCPTWQTLNGSCESSK